MIKELEITVTEENIKEGLKQSKICYKAKQSWSTCCLISQSIREMYSQVPYVFTTKTNLEFRADGHYFYGNLPLKAKEFITSVDNFLEGKTKGTKIKPISFKIKTRLIMK